jgi:hypothetical protein
MTTGKADKFNIAPQAWQYSRYLDCRGRSTPGYAMPALF